MAQKGTPKYYSHRRAAGDLAYVYLSGQRYYLGNFGTPESYTKFYQLVAEWHASGARMPVLLPEDRRDNSITIKELCARFTIYAQSYYRNPDGTATSELLNFEILIKLLNKLYGSTPAAEFGPLKLKAVREEMVIKKGVRSSINRKMSRIRSIFKWGVENEIIPASVVQGLQAISGLQLGRCGAEESDPVLPVPDAHIEAIKPFVSRQVWAMIELQLHTGARPGEIVVLRSIDINTQGRVWTYSPSKHKTRHRGKSRIIFIGPKAQVSIKQFMQSRSLDAFLFSPLEAVREKYQQRPTHQGKNRVPNKPKTERKIRDQYDVTSYRKAIKNARMETPPWQPR